MILSGECCLHSLYHNRNKKSWDDVKRRYNDTNKSFPSRDKALFIVNVLEWGGWCDERMIYLLLAC